MCKGNPHTNSATCVCPPDRGSALSHLLVSPASPVPAVPSRRASSFPTPLRRLPPPPPSITTPPQPFPTSPPLTLRSHPTTPPPLFHTSTPCSPSANIPPHPSLAPLDPGLPASLLPRRPRLLSLSAPHLRRASGMFPLPARSHMYTCKPSQSGMNTF